MIPEMLVQAGVTPQLALENLAVFVPLIVCARLLRIHTGDLDTAPVVQEQATQETYHTQDYPHQQ